MSLRTRAIALSLLPFMITLLLAFPEGILQLRVSADAALARHEQHAAQAARDIGDNRASLSIEIRRWANGDSTSAARYGQTVLDMRASMDALDKLAGPDPAKIELARRINADAAKVIADFNSIQRFIRRGQLVAAAADKTSPGYFEDAEALQQSVRTFVAAGSGAQDSALASFQRLADTSVALLLIALAGLVISTAFLWYTLTRAAETISELGSKAERYRNGEPLGAISARHDELGLLDARIHEFVANQRQRERELKRYQLLVEVTNDIILFVDRADLTVIDANVAALKAYGYANLVGIPTATLHAVDDPIDSATIALSDRPEGLSYEGVHQRADGTVFPVEVHARTADVEGRLTIIKTIRDISERRRAAEQISLALDHAVEASRLKSEFVATMSHEIRTPMHGVIGMSELLLETQLMPVQREYAATVKESAQALLAIIDDILDFSKLEALKIELEVVTFDPAQLVASAINLARGTAREKGLTLRSDASPNVPSAVRGDPTRVRQVLINLIGNAVKFTATGEITVSTSVERDDGRALVLAFAVNDTGIGITPGTRERLFEPFVQGDGSTTRRFGGTGLGLSISRRLVELMGGRIWLGEHEGPGSTFCFTARFERTVEMEIVAPVALTADGLRVLVLVLDDEPSRLAHEVALASWGMRSGSAGDIETARTKLHEAARNGTPFDVVLIDHVVPGSDGLAFASELGTHPDYGGPAYILVTALDAAGKEAALAAGCAGYLAKPLAHSDLYDALNQIESARKAHRIVPAYVGHRARILMAEDSALIRRVARFQLQELTYAVDIVENGMQAVEAVATGNYELVLMDMRMPDMDGLAATRAIRKAEQTSGRHIVVVALTANVLEGDRDACAEAGMDDFLAKPLNLDALRTALERWLPKPA